MTSGPCSSSAVLSTIRSSAFGSAQCGAGSPGLSTRPGAPDARNSSTARRMVATISGGRFALGSWIYRITTNVSLNKRRGKRRELETSLDELLPTYLPDGHRAGDRAFLLADWSRTPEGELLSGESRRLLEAAIDRLPEHYRAVLVLKDVDALSSDEVAESVGDSVAAVKTRLHRARMALREQLTRRLGAGA